jgi:putative oxidoreductase
VGQEEESCALTTGSDVFQVDRDVKRLDSDHSAAGGRHHDFPAWLAENFWLVRRRGFLSQMAGFERSHIPAVFAFLAIMAEFLGGLGLLLGALTRIAAFGLAVDMMVGVYLLHWRNGFFMNWSGHQKGEGFEFHILVVAMAIVLMARGGGAASVDRALAKK